MKSQEKYWDRKIEGWTNTSYKGGFAGFDLIERLASLFRRPIVGRMETALKLLKPRVRNKTVMDLGCGLGDFIWLILEHHPQKTIGIDISGVAIKVARQMAKEKGISNKVEFRRADVGSIKSFPDFDIAVGLGFIDYLTKSELRRLFRLLEGKVFLFSFFEKKLSVKNIIHEIYMKWKKCPGAYKYTKRQMESLAPKDLGLKFLKKDGLLFVTNLKKIE